MSTKRAQFTPGPWVMRPDSTIESKDGVTVASFIDNKADMPLIAAAPAMYEALQAALAYFMRSKQSHAPETQVIRTALAQAKGRQA